MNGEWAIVKVITAICGGIGAYFSLSKQETEYTLKSVLLFLTVGIVVSFFGTPFAVKYAVHKVPHIGEDWDLLLSAAGLTAFVLGIFSMNLASFLYNASVTLKDDPAKFFGWISTVFTKLAALFGGKK